MDALWIPHPANRPQQAAFICPATELLYGGAAGGGKSDLLLGLAVCSHQISIIMRREYAQLEALVSRSKEIIPEGGDLRTNFNAGKNIWYKLPGRRKLEFGASQYPPDVKKFQGRPHDLVCFDELTHFTEYQYLYMTGWLRTNDPLQRLRIVSASNPPPTAEGYWVKKRWAPWVDRKHHDPALPGELRWVITDEDGKELYVDGPRVQTYDLLDGRISYEEAFATPDPIKVNGVWQYPSSRTFIPAGVRDNPYYSHDPKYVARLQALMEPLRSQLLNGDWEAGTEDDAHQVIPTRLIYEATARWEAATARQLDPGRLIALGVDVARGGKDNTVLAPLYEDLYFGELLTRPGVETPDGASVVGMMVPLELKGVQVNIDAIGVGGAVIDSAKETIKGANIRGITFSAGSNATDKSGTFRMKNARAEAYWGFREMCEDGVVMIPPDPELIADLAAPRYKPVAGKIGLESKAQITKRLGRSPDAGDAVVLAAFRYGQHDMMAWLTEEGYGVNEDEV